MRMSSRLAAIYKQLVIQRPVLLLTLLSLLLIVAIFQAQHFKLDASADSLTLEDDADVAYYLESRDHFPASDDFLVIAISSEKGVFHSDTLALLKALKADLLTVDNVDSINSILDVPLLNDPDIELTTITDHIRILEEGNVSIEMARQELMTNPLYKGMLVSED